MRKKENEGKEGPFKKETERESETQRVRAATRVVAEGSEGRV